MLRELFRDTRGVTAIFFALTLPAIIGFSALGVEVGYWYFEQRTLQETADIAAYSGAVKLRESKSKTIATAVARDDAIAHGFDELTETIEINMPPASGPNQDDHSAEAIIVAQRERFLTQLISDEPVVIRVRAVAAFEDDGTACVLALNTSAPGAVTVTGNAQVEFQGCTVMSNSVAADSVEVGGSAHLAAPCVRAVGGIEDSTGIELTECSEVRQFAPYVPDPYADLEEPSTAGACQHVPNSPHGTPITVSPGRYCNGFDLRGDVTLEPGVYVIDDGEFRINANANIAGEGVMFFLTDDAEVDFNGNADIQLTAPDSGTYKGILFFGDRSNSSGNGVKFNGTADSSLVGALYFPKQSVEILGDFAGSNGCTQIVSQTVTFSGSTDFSADCTYEGMNDITLAGRVQIVE